MNEKELEFIADEISKSLGRYEAHLRLNGVNVTFGNSSDINGLNKLVGPIESPKNKPNTARTVLPVYYGKSNVADLYAIVFGPGDGTGDPSTFKLDEVEIPEKYRFEEKPERVLPREKKCEVEYALPLCTIVNKQVVLRNVATLDELCIVDDITREPLSELEIEEPEGGLLVENAYRLGLAKNEFKKMIDSAVGRVPVAPAVWMTTGYRRDGTRFGHHHAMYLPKDISELAEDFHVKLAEDVYVIMGFFAIEKQGMHIVERLEGIAKPPRRI